MLTADLIRVRNTREGLKCGFVDASNARLLEKAAAILTAFELNVGNARSALDDALLEAEGDGVDHKLTRGLAKLAVDRAEFDTRAPMPPADVRKAIFGLAARIGPVRPAAPPLDGDASVDLPRTADGLWQALGTQLGIDPSELARSLYADLASEQTLTSVDVPSAGWLLHRYNVALVQSALLHAQKLTLTLAHPSPGPLRALLRALKFHQLLADVRRTAEADANVTIVIDGPASLFAQTTRYGLALAKFFPAIPLLGTPWALRADILWKGRTTKLELDSRAGLVSHYAERGAWQSREATWFFERWMETAPGWTIEVGGPPLDQGGEGMVVPDFTMRRDGDARPVHIEILGYWRKASLQRRLALMRRHGPERLILAASKKLLQAEEREEVEGGLGDAVVLFTEVIPVKEVLRLATAMLDATPRRQRRSATPAPTPRP